VTDSARYLFSTQLKDCCDERRIRSALFKTAEQISKISVERTGQRVNKSW